MKRILFILGNFDSGGVTKSLLNMLHVIDKEKYQISLLLMSGVDSDLMKLIPQNFTIYQNEITQNLLNKWSGVFRLLKSKYFFIAFCSILRMILSVINKGYAGLLLSKLFPKLDADFDIIVDYNGQQNLYYMVDTLKAKTKITFFHSDYNKWPYYKIIDKKYYPKVDYIFTCSNECVKSLKDNFPNSADKIYLMENIASPAIINHLADTNIDDEVLNLKRDFTLVSVGHICYNKGTDLSLKAAQILKEKGYSFKWIFIGNVLDTKYIDRCNKMGLDDYIYFIGVKSNPYPYIFEADIFVHTSRFEGKSIALDEAKLLCKPIVVTNFSTVNDQFENRINASICPIDEKNISSAIEELMLNHELRDKYIQFLKNNIVDNSEEINKLYRIFDCD